MALAIVMMMAVAIIPVQAKKVTIGSDGTMIVVKGNDTVRISNGAGLSRLGVNIANAIDDTLINVVPGDTVQNAAGVTVRNGEDEWGLTTRIISAQWTSVVHQVAFLSVVGLVLIVLLVLLFRYLNRRSKLRVIEKAIENNYPLPESLMAEGRRTVIVQQPPVVVQSTASSNASQSAQPVPTAVTGVPMGVGFYSWDALKSSVKWLAWGLGIMLFFLFAGEPIPASVGIALIFVGLAKWYIRYQEIKAINEQLQRQPPVQQRPVAPPQFNADDNNNANQQ